MQGQWKGESTSNGKRFEIILDAEVRQTTLSGSILAYNKDDLRERIYGQIQSCEISNNSALAVAHVNFVNPETNGLIYWQDIPKHFPQTPIATLAQIRLTQRGDLIDLSFNSNIGTAGNITLSTTDPTRPSQLNAIKMTWQEFKDYALGLDHRKHIFRGQRETWRLRSHYHRAGGGDLWKYLMTHLPELRRHISAQTRHLFDLTKPEEYGALLHLAQHHGFPTPLIDWSNSPFVASYFAFHRISNIEADSENNEKHTRIFIFDREAWLDRYNQINAIALMPPNLSLYEFMAIENPRLLPQQALSAVTNVNDVEDYISMREAESGVIFLSAIDIPHSERRKVMRELALMGITASTLFPGLDGVCEELRERLFE